MAEVCEHVNCRFERAMEMRDHYGHRHDCCGSHPCTELSAGGDAGDDR